MQQEYVKIVLRFMAEDFRKICQFTSMESLRISPMSSYGNFFLKIGLGIAKDISKMDLTRKLCRHNPALPTRLEIGVGIFFYATK